jgi:hypothetical protein
MHVACWGLDQDLFVMLVILLVAGIRFVRTTLTSLLESVHMLGLQDDSESDGAKATNL